MARIVDKYKIDKHGFEKYYLLVVSSKDYFDLGVLKILVNKEVYENFSKNDKITIRIIV